ncbi:cytochrome c oxidase assembly protein [Teichococcus oryzae]|uniref:Cytochrome c oxidase assembly protein n=1 Tax=Teichococcus oryzae TaxID=1608942 RepID=A0A5B2TCX3_9PROT|nr:cytochrome c oxidase assembly protein [Pseudoroseomonas oryzae]KAA2211630.1 cytochrome c oxidase assembly protein [Pseudoroseomonas oryzae]
MTSYCGLPPDPFEWLHRWNMDPLLLLALGCAAAMAPWSRHPHMIWAATGALALAFVSPLCALSVALFSARAVHHLLIVTVAAPLLALAFPARRSSNLGVAFAISTLTLWAWHLPSLYDWALADTAMYWLMQISLLGTAAWFWRALFAAPPVTAALSAILGMAQMGMLGALLTFSKAPLYAAHFGTTLPWGLEQVADQQLAGLVMWVPGVIPYAVALALLARRAWVRVSVAT